MRTLLSSILVLGLSAQPILAQQRMIADADAVKAAVDGVMICDEYFKTKKDVGELFDKKVEEIPEYIKEDSRLLEGYLALLKRGFLSCMIGRTKNPELKK